MKIISAPLTTHLGLSVTTLATLWELTRTDGVQFFFTDHDKDISFNGNTYLASSGYKRTAVSNQVGLSVDNIDVEGVFDGNQLDEDELRVGLFDYAEIKMMVINYESTSDGVLKLRRGKLGEVAFTPQGFYKAELRGMSQVLSQNMVEMYTAECRVDLGDPKCMIPVFPSVLGREQAVLEGEFYRVPTKTLTGIDWLGLGLNMGFENEVAGLAKATINGWTVNSGTWNVFASDQGLTPDEGSLFLSGGDTASGSMEQTIDLEAIGVSLTEIDAGNATADFSVRRANQSTILDTGRVIVQFRDANQITLSTPLDTTSEAITPEDTWVTRSFTGTALPANTRFIRISISYSRVSGGEADTSFDNLVLTVHDTTSTNAFQEIYENRVYEVTVAGTTAVGQPVYDTTIGNTTVDGTATLTARDAFMRHGHISDVIDNKTLEISVSEARAVDGWFDQGAMVFESTNNTGKAHEVRDWTQADSRSVSFLPPPFPATAGAKIRIYPGCDKRLTTCINKFTNAINFRGEPFIPGQDAFQRLADVR
jgi:hypothetical protein